MLPTGDEQETARSRASWLVPLAVITLIGLGVRLAAVFVLEPNLVPRGDAFDYHNAANLLVSGHGMIDPVAYLRHHRVVEGAAFPPLFTLLLATASAVGWKTFFAHQIWTSIIGTASVPVLGIAGREMAGRRVGLVAAGIAAIYPNIWLNDAFVHSETLSILLVGLLIWTAYRFRHRPTLGRAVTLGLVLGFAVLARDELALMAVLLVAPLVLLARSEPLRRRLTMLGASLLTAAVLIAPWVGYNMSRFQDPVFISTGFGVTLASANCPTTYGGADEGYWSYFCAYHLLSRSPPGDQSVTDNFMRTRALDYETSHAGHVPALTAARLGRAFGFFRPVQQVDFDILVEGRSRTWANVGLYSYYVLLALALAGLYLLRRRRVTIIPLVAVLLNVVATVVVTFGQTRYRAPFEVVVALSSAVTLDAIARGWAHRRSARSRLSTAEPPDVATSGAPTVDRHRGNVGSGVRTARIGGFRSGDAQGAGSWPAPAR